jgi:lipopolysaccharide biosynthesis regulator YciM
MQACIWEIGLQQYTHSNNSNNSILIINNVIIFLEAVATRSAGNLAQSIALFAQVTDPEFAQDVMRYLLLLYEETGDTERFLEQAEELAIQSWLTVHDFYTVFDLFLLQTN